ncbi:unnamed protein product [Paramecium octaurelia]|uniref:Alpha-tubulin n=2 Tax=Paramecium octaurelia TaxID=43137 RepID=A0A8S1W7Z1_PAROT|nr:unnamed protein product [Paramecium octaurelia]
MREIISLHIGQAGLQIGNSLWELFCLEHSIQPDGTVPTDRILEGLNSNIDSLFSLSQYGRYVPRAIFFDEDPTTINAIKNGPSRGLFNRSYIHQCQVESGGCWARSFGTIMNKEGEEKIADKIRKQVESCDGLQGIMLYHSIGGGFGGGFTSKILDLLSSDLEKVTKATVSVLSSNHSLQSSLLEPYNSILTLKYLKEKADMSIMLENQALYKVANQQLDIDNPNFSTINRMIAQLISSVTQSSRFNGSKFVDLIEMRMNVVPDPDFQFLHASYAPFINIDKQNTELTNLQQITNSLFDERSSFINCDHKNVKYLAANLFFRGDCPWGEVKGVVESIKQSPNIKFAEFAVPTYQIAISDKAPVPFPYSEQGRSNKAVCMIANSSAIETPLFRIKRNARRQYSKRSHVHWLVGEGREEGEISEALEIVQSFLKNYKEANYENPDKDYCTRVQHGTDYIRQFVYTCDCLDVEGYIKNGIEKGEDMEGKYLGVCVQCAKKCHVGHNLKVKGIENEFFCDCGLENCKVKCQCQKEEAQGQEEQQQQQQEQEKN